MTKFKINYDKEGCLGCGVCIVVCPKFWEMGPDSHAILKEAKNNELEFDEKYLKCNFKAATGCISSVIHIHDEQGKELSYNDMLKILADMGDEEAIKLLEKESEMKEINKFMEKYKLQMINNEISEKDIEKILDGIINKDEKYIGFLRYIPSYLIKFKKKKFCNKLKQILEVFGTKELLLDRTESILYQTIEAVKELECKECLPKLKEISSFGLTKMNGRVSFTVEEALEKLEKNYKSEYIEQIKKEVKRRKMLETMRKK